jgi:hypothetical protein
MAFGNVLVHWELLNQSKLSYPDFQLEDELFLEDENPIYQAA